MTASLPVMSYLSPII